MNLASCDFVAAKAGRNYRTQGREGINPWNSAPDRFRHRGEIVLGNPTFRQGDLP
ncbi:hypothetical protein [Alkalinema sp. FACHB-956]|uniref:hypothetical protein n=1 Tax=Alkalinema sp. FACHB-956 TaxID=2692768 RepID=UPI0016825C2F|nr:hypothetical protein [Alkalinema sp. FACHB-956]MBD2327561.1 hypothetical protein [Alkalinema sp. FACHB-956]